MSQLRGRASYAALAFGSGQSVLQLVLRVAVMLLMPKLLSNESVIGQRFMFG